MSREYREWNIEQTLLFPKSVQDYVPEGHPARFIVRLVKEEISFKELEKKYQEAKAGPPAYSPRMMTGILLYGYMRGEYSSRNLSRACEERVDFMLISGMSKPDFRTIANFRRRTGAELQKIFIEVVRLCREAGLADLKHVAIDGTRIKANASADKNKSYKQIKEEEKKLEREVKEWLDKAEELDKEEDDEHGGDDRGDILPHAEEALSRIREAKKRLEEQDRKAREERAEQEKAGIKARKAQKLRSAPNDKTKHNFTDRDSRVMKTRRGFIQGYNGQLAVDSKNQIVVSCYVTSAQADIEELKPMIKEINKVCKINPLEVSLDTGYCSEENLRALEEESIRGYVALGNKPDTPSRAIPPGSLRLKMKERLRKGASRSRYKIRMKTVEPVIGIIKQVRKFREFLLRGIEAVNTEWSLVCTSHNLWKLFAAT